MKYIILTILTALVVTGCGVRITTIDDEGMFKECIERSSKNHYDASGKWTTKSLDVESIKACADAVTQIKEAKYHQDKK